MGLTIITFNHAAPAGKIGIMKKIIHRIFGKWDIVYSTFSVWDIDTGGGNATDWCGYEILKLKGANDYKIKCFGFKSKLRSQYGHIVELCNLYKSRA